VAEIKVIQTKFAGHFFRSRTEARWAVFFKTLGLKYKYEIEGFEFDGGLRYLPDFWLPELGLWFEVKGVEPTDKEVYLVHLLSDRSKKDAIIAIGAPKDGDEQLIVFPGDARKHSSRWAYISDSLCSFPIPFHFNTFLFKGDEWLVARNDYLGIVIEFPWITASAKSVAHAYDAASCARFEYEDAV
jgi:hypothetical protein